MLQWSAQRYFLKYAVFPLSLESMAVAGTWQQWWPHSDRERGTPGFWRPSCASCHATEPDRWPRLGRDGRPLAAWDGMACASSRPGLVLILSACSEISTSDPTVRCPGAAIDFSRKDHARNLEPARQINIPQPPRCLFSSLCRATPMLPSNTSSLPGKARRRGARMSTFPRCRRVLRSSTTR